VGILLASLAFWVPRQDLHSLFSNAWQLARYPADIYARPLRHLFTYAVALALIATVSSPSSWRTPPGAGDCGGTRARPAEPSTPVTRCRSYQRFGEEVRAPWRMAIQIHTMVQVQIY